MASLPVEAIVDAVDGVHGLRVKGHKPALVLLDRRLLLAWTRKKKYRGGTERKTVKSTFHVYTYVDTRADCNDANHFGIYTEHQTNLSICSWEAPTSRRGGKTVGGRRFSTKSAKRLPRGRFSATVITSWACEVIITLYFY